MCWSTAPQRRERRLQDDRLSRPSRSRRHDYFRGLRAGPWPTATSTPPRTRDLIQNGPRRRGKIGAGQQRRGYIDLSTPSSYEGPGRCPATPRGPGGALGPTTAAVAPAPALEQSPASPTAATPTTTRRLQASTLEPGVRATRAAACDAPPPADAATGRRELGPPSGASEVDSGRNLRVTFSEPVTAGRQRVRARLQRHRRPARRLAHERHDLRPRPAVALPGGRCTLRVEGGDYPTRTPTTRRTPARTTPRASTDARRPACASTTSRAPAPLALDGRSSPGARRRHRAPRPTASGSRTRSPTPTTRTSEGIFVFTSSAPDGRRRRRRRGDGRPAAVSEFRAGGATGANLTTTELDRPDRATQPARGTIAPDASSARAAASRRHAGRSRTTRTGDVEQRQTPTVRPEQDGIDFHESLEGMLVQVNDAVAVGPTNSFGELPALGRRRPATPACARRAAASIVQSGRLQPRAVHPRRRCTGDAADVERRRHALGADRRRRRLHRSATTSTR